MRLLKKNLVKCTKLLPPINSKTIGLYKGVPCIIHYNSYFIEETKESTEQIITIPLYEYMYDNKIGLVTRKDSEYWNKNIKELQWYNLIVK